MKGVSYVLLAAVLVLAIVFFVQSRDSNNGANPDQTPEEKMSGDLAGTRMAGEVFAFPGGTYEVDAISSRISWKGEKKLVDTRHEGTIAIKSGLFSVTEEGLVSSGEVIVDMDSIALVEGDTGGDQLMGHLRSEDFFSVSEYPEARLQIVEVSGTPERQQVSAVLTIKDKTNPVAFELIPTFGPADQPALGGRLVIDRSDFDVRFGSESFFADLGDAIIKDEFVLDFVLVGTPIAAELE